MSDDPDGKTNSFTNHTDRREVIRRMGHSALGAGISLGLLETMGCADSKENAESTHKYESRNMVEGMSYRPFGKTNLMVSRLAIGGDRWDSEVARQAISRGVNLVHGSVGYKTMENQTEALRGMWNKIWYVLKHTGKVEDMGKTLDNCLQTTKQDHVEIMAFVVRETGVTDYEAVKAEFEQLKQAGKVKRLGVTVHTRTVPEVCREVISSDIFDMILTMYQPARKEAIDKELAVAIQRNMATMSMKTIQGIDKKDGARAIAAALASGNICTVLKGMTDLNDLEEYLKIAGASQSSLVSLGRRIRTDKTACDACGKCTACPQNIEIQEIMRCATYYERESTLQDYARQTYREIPAMATAHGCTDCGICESICPRNLPIRQILTDAGQKWDAIA